MDNDLGVLYLISGDRHVNVLAVSIYSLRHVGFRLPIHIAVGDDYPEPMVEMMAKDARLGPITWARWDKPSLHRNDKYRQKCFMDGLSPFDKTVYLDADTLVRGSLKPLFEFSPDRAVTLTQFSDWNSNGRKIPNRIRPWNDVANADVQEMLARAYPAINTGIIAFDKSSGSQKFFQEWRELTAKKIVFICDELSAQLIFWRHACRVVDDRWNASPIHSNRTDAIIWHGHGSKFIKREQGRKIWLPWYEACVEQNIAGIAEWTPAGDKRLREYLLGGDDEETVVVPEDEDAAV